MPPGRVGGQTHGGGALIRKERAEREGNSLPALERDILGASSTPSSPAVRSSLDAIAGAGEDAVAHGEHYDQYLYPNENPPR